MGQTISDMVFGNRESSESSNVPEPALDAPQSVPEPSVDVSNASVAIPEPTSAVSQSSISVSGPTLDTHNAQQAPHLAPSPQLSLTFNVLVCERRDVASYPKSRSKMEDFVRKLNHKNNCSGETFVDATYHEGERIKELIIEHLPYVNITRVCLVKNSFVMGMYELKKAEYKSRYGNRAVKELTMFHATDANNVDSIIKDNLDWRRVYRNKYGIGVSFSEDPDWRRVYRNKYGIGVSFSEDPDWRRVYRNKYGIGVSFSEDPDWRRVYRNKYGIGVSFSEDPDWRRVYRNKYGIGVSFSEDPDWRRVYRNKYGIGVSFSEDPDWRRVYRNKYGIGVSFSEDPDWRRVYRNKYGIGVSFSEDPDWRRVYRNKYGIGVSFSEDPDWRRVYRNKYGIGVSFSEDPDWRRVYRNKYGIGVSFSEDPDWRRVYRNKYGIGVSFSEDPDYCNFHCTPKNGYHRVFIVASVLVCRQTYGDYGMVVPPETYDTAVGNNNLVYVKFNDNEFLPKYLVFYDSPPRSRSKYWINYPRRW